MPFKSKRSLKIDEHFITTMNNTIPQGEREYIVRVFSLLSGKSRYRKVKTLEEADKLARKELSPTRVVKVSIGIRVYRMARKG